MFSFVIPCFNEQANIEQTIGEIDAAMADAGIRSYDVVVVDDCSADQTRDVVRALCAKRSDVTLVCNPVNLGFGGAYKAGIEQAAGAFVMMIPGDNSYPREGITRIVSCAGEADIIIPYAVNPEARNVSRIALSRSFTWLVNSLFGLNVPYYNGTVLHKTELLRSITIKTNSFAYQAEALVKLIRAGASFKSVPVMIVERTVGRSSALRLKNVVQVGQCLSQLLVDVYLRRPSVSPKNQSV